MKLFIHYSFLILVVLIFATSCKKSVPDQTKYIPKDAMFVFDMDWKTLSEKASKGNINWDSLFKSVAEPGNDSKIAEAKKKFDDLLHSGLDLEKNVFGFVRMGGSMMNSQSVSGGIVAGMKDASNFESYIKKQPGVSEIKKESKYTYTTFGDDMFVGWNSSVVILSGAGARSQKYSDSSGGASLGNSAEINAQQVLSALFNQKEDESVASIPEFRDLMKEKGDILVWSNSSNMFNAVPLLGMTKISDLFKDSYGAGTINFDNGKLGGNFKSYSGKDLAEIWKKYAGPVTDMNMVNQYPFPVSGYAAFSFNTQIITEIIKFAGLESTVNQFLQKAGFDLNDIMKAFKGDFAIVFSDLSFAEIENEYNGMKYKSKQPSVKLLFNAAIGDKASYDKIVSKLAEQGEMELQKGQYVPKGMGDEFAWNMNGKNLIIATDANLIQQYLAGKGNAAVPQDIAASSKGKSFAFYVDINKILQSISVDSANLKSMDVAKTTFKNVIATADNYNGNYVAGNFTLATMNDKENSLVTLVKFFAAASKEIEKGTKTTDGEAMSDTDTESEESLSPPLPSK